MEKFEDLYYDQTKLRWHRSCEICRSKRRADKRRSRERMRELRKGPQARTRTQMEAANPEPEAAPAQERAGGQESSFMTALRAEYASAAAAAAKRRRLEPRPPSPRSSAEGAALFMRSEDGSRPPQPAAAAAAAAMAAAMQMQMQMRMQMQMAYHRYGAASWPPYWPSYAAPSPHAVAYARAMHMMSAWSAGASSSTTSSPPSSTSSPTKELGADGARVGSEMEAVAGLIAVGDAP